MKRAAVFLDRDGTLIEDCGFLGDPKQVKFFPETIPALHRLKDEFELFIVTNQRGVAEGVTSLADVNRVNDHVVRVLQEAGITIRAVYCCPHRREEGCECIKPKPFFLRQAEREHGIDLARSFAIGDHPHDVELAANAGARGIFVLTGHGTKHRDELPASCVVVPGIGEAADYILQSLL
jgi:histidinol-phosphate phosphatase family protein